MAARTFDLLKAQEGMTASINGATQIPRWRVKTSNHHPCRGAGRETVGTGRHGQCAHYRDPDPHHS